MGETNYRGGVMDIALAMLNQIIAELEGGFISCQRCGDQEETTNLDCMYDLKKLRNLLAAAPSHSEQVPAVAVPDDYKLMPKQITKEMADAFWEEYSKDRADDLLMRCYKAMYVTAPSHSQQSAESDDSEQEDQYPPPHVIDAWKSHCSCCPDCCNHPCDGVAAGGMCDSAECDCFD